MKIIVFLFLSLNLTTSHAEKYIPNSPDIIVANWLDLQSVDQSKVSDLNQALLIAQEHLSRANSIGQNYLYGLAESLLEPYIEKQNNPEFWLAWARIQGHQHDFIQALNSLNKVLDRDPKNINANLMLARFQIIQRNYSSAKSSCHNLIDSIDLTSASICLLEVMSHQGKLKESYRQLKLIKDKLSSKSQYHQWSLSILAEMAYRLNEFKQSEFWLDQKQNDVTVSHLIEWSDIKLLLNKPDQIVAKLTPLLKNNSSIEDSLLLRLAIAEKQINNFNHSGSNTWLSKIKQRINLRQKRLDSQHASDLALYYIEIEKNPKKALYWAQLNWQQVKEHKDFELIEKAKNMNSKTHNKRVSKIDFTRIKL